MNPMDDVSRPEPTNRKRPESSPSLITGRPAIVYINDMNKPQDHFKYVSRGFLRNPTMDDVIWGARRDLEKEEVLTVWTGTGPYQDYQVSSLLLGVR